MKKAVLIYRLLSLTFSFIGFYGCGVQTFGPAEEIQSMTEAPIAASRFTGADHEFLRIISNSETPESTAFYSFACELNIIDDQGLDTQKIRHEILWNTLDTVIHRFSEQDHALKDTFIYAKLYRESATEELMVVLEANSFDKSLYVKAPLRTGIKAMLTMHNKQRTSLLVSCNPQTKVMQAERRVLTETLITKDFKMTHEMAYRCKSNLQEKIFEVQPKSDTLILQDIVQGNYELNLALPNATQFEHVFTLWSIQEDAKVIIPAWHLGDGAEKVYFYYNDTHFGKEIQMECSPETRIK